jgi:hypothetical protein
MQHIRHAVIQRKLDDMDETIDTLAREKAAASDDDLAGDLEEARQIQQRAREEYSRGEFHNALLSIYRADFCLCLGREALTKWKDLLADIGKALGVDQAGGISTSV